MQKREQYKPNYYAKKKIADKGETSTVVSAKDIKDVKKEMENMEQKIRIAKQQIQTEEEKRIVSKTPMTYTQFQEEIKNFIEIVDIYKDVPLRKTFVKYAITRADGTTEYFKGGYLIKLDPRYITLGNTTDADIKKQQLQTGALFTDFRYYVFYVQIKALTDEGATVKFWRKMNDEEIDKKMEEYRGKICLLEQRVEQLEKQVNNYKLTGNIDDAEEKIKKVVKKTTKKSVKTKKDNLIE